MLFVPLCVKNIAPYRGLPTLHYPRALCVRRDARPRWLTAAPYRHYTRGSHTQYSRHHYARAPCPRATAPHRPWRLATRAPVGSPQNRPRWLTAARRRAASPVGAPHPVAARHPGRHATRADYSCGISNSSKMERTRVPFSMAFVWRKWRMGVYFSPTVFARCA